MSIDFYTPFLQQKVLYIWDKSVFCELVESKWKRTGSRNVGKQMSKIKNIALTFQFIWKFCKNNLSIWIPATCTVCVDFRLCKPNNPLVSCHSMNNVTIITAILASFLYVKVKHTMQWMGQSVVQLEISILIVH